MAASIAASAPRILIVRILSLLTKPSRAFAAGVGHVDQSVLLLVRGANKRFITSIECDLGDMRQSDLADNCARTAAVVAAPSTLTRASHRALANAAPH